MSIAITMAIKYLMETPRALHELREEHEEILRRKRRKGELYLTWEDYKSMAFTLNVIKETLRLSNIGPFLYRECMQETKIKGQDFHYEGSFYLETKIKGQDFHYEGSFYFLPGCVW
jgi:cytochrome P450